AVDDIDFAVVEICSKQNVTNADRCAGQARVNCAIAGCEPDDGRGPRGAVPPDNLSGLRCKQEEGVLAVGKLEGCRARIEDVSRRTARHRDDERKFAPIAVVQSCQIRALIRYPEGARSRECDSPWIRQLGVYDYGHTRQVGDEIGLEVSHGITKKRDQAATTS